MTTLAEMITLFKRRTSGLGDSLTDADITSRLDDQYIYVLPNEVDGYYFKNEWHFPLYNSTWTIPDSVVAVSNETGWVLPASKTSPVIQGALVENTEVARRPVPVSWDFVEFVHDFPKYLSMSGYMTRVCVFEDKLHFDEQQDGDSDYDAYHVYMTVRAVPQHPFNASGFQNYGAMTLSDLGSLEYLLARAVVSGASHEFLIENEDEEGAGREWALFQSYLATLRTKSRSARQVHSSRRSF